MKKILFITNSSLDNPRRGTPLRMLSVARQIAKEHKLVICTKDIADDVKAEFVAYPKGNAMQRFLFFKKLIKKHKVDIVLAHTEMEVRMPVFLKLFTGVKIVLDMHGLYAEEMYYHGLMNNRKRWLVDKVVRFFLRFYNMLFICNLKHKQYYSHVANKMRLVYNGVESKFLEVQSNQEPEVFTIGYAGNLKPYQGFDYLLTALAEIKKKKLFDFRLNFVLSSGTTHIEGMLKEHNLLDNADLHFKVPHGEVSKIITKSSVLVVPRPSLKMTEYAYPSKLPSDLLTGIPTITTNVGPIEQLFKPADCCVVIATDDIAKNLEQALVKVHGMNSQDRRDLGQRAVNFVKTTLSWDILGKDINKYLGEL
ncbi:glycosyltransferase [Candidatus Parcubacteria bacterium]|jgi:glycosyltransferase involved in cell wall biosynthesis|nr:glycosyltransferase [Candidatus Parcubacteria bacterium]